MIVDAHLIKPTQFSVSHRIRKLHPVTSPFTISYITLWDTLPRGFVPRALCQSQEPRKEHAVHLFSGTDCFSPEWAFNSWEKKNGGRKLVGVTRLKWVTIVRLTWLLCTLKIVSYFFPFNIVNLLNGTFGDGEKRPLQRLSRYGVLGPKLHDRCNIFGQKCTNKLRYINSTVTEQRQSKVVRYDSSLVAFYK